MSKSICLSNRGPSDRFLYDAPSRLIEDFLPHIFLNHVAKTIIYVSANHLKTPCHTK